MSLKKILQAKLLEKHYLSINDVIKIAEEQGHYLDTARRCLEPNKTPFAKKIYDSKHHIAGWALLKTVELYQENKIELSEYKKDEPIPFNTNPIKEREVSQLDSQISPKTPPRSVLNTNNDKTPIQDTLFNLNTVEAKKKTIWDYN